MESLNVLIEDIKRMGESEAKEAIEVMYNFISANQKMKIYVRALLKG